MWLEHERNLFDIPEDELNNLIAFLQNTAKSYKTWLWATGVNILNANGKDAQQSVLHLHFHLVPRFPHDHLDLRPKFPNYDWKLSDVLVKIKKKCAFWFLFLLSADILTLLEHNLLKKKLKSDFTSFRILLK